jgi:hypothetical protein
LRIPMPSIELQACLPFSGRACITAIRCLTSTCINSAMCHCQCFGHAARYSNCICNIPPLCNEAWGRSIRPLKSAGEGRPSLRSACLHQTNGCQGAPAESNEARRDVSQTEQEATVKVTAGGGASPAGQKRHGGLSKRGARERAGRNGGVRGNPPQAHQPQPARTQNNVLLLQPAAAGIASTAVWEQGEIKRARRGVGSDWKELGAARGDRRRGCVQRQKARPARGGTGGELSAAAGCRPAQTAAGEEGRRQPVWEHG